MEGFCLESRHLKNDFIDIILNIMCRMEYRRKNARVISGNCFKSPRLEKMVD